MHLNFVFWYLGQCIEKWKFELTEKITILRGIKWKGKIQKRIIFTGPSQEEINKNVGMEKG